MRGRKVSESTKAITTNSEFGDSFIAVQRRESEKSKLLPEVSSTEEAKQKSKEGGTISFEFLSIPTKREL